MDTVNMLNTMRFYCQPILPLVYDESMSYYETLCKVVGQLNTTGETVNKLNEGLTKEIADRQAADTALDERLKKVEEQDKRIHFLVFEGASPMSVMPTRSELYNWVRDGDAIFTLFHTDEEGRGQIYAASCSYNAGNWGSEASNDFNIIVPIETTYDASRDYAVKQKVAKLAIPLSPQTNLNSPWRLQIIEVNTPSTSAEGVVNLTASLSGSNEVNCSITPSEFLGLYNMTRGGKNLCVAVNARLEYDAHIRSSSIATVNPYARTIVITFEQDNGVYTDYGVNQTNRVLHYLIGNAETNTWEHESIRSRIQEFVRYEGFQFTRKSGNVIATENDSTPSAVYSYYTQLNGKLYQNLPTRLIDEVDGAEYWNGVFDSYSDGHITFTFTTANYATIGDKMTVRVIELSATKAGSLWSGAEKWSYAAKEFDIPYRPTSYAFDVWETSDTPAVINGIVTYAGGSNLDFDDLLPLVENNQRFVATLHKGISETAPEWSSLVYSSQSVKNGVGNITFAITTGINLENGIPVMDGTVVFSKDASGAKKVQIVFASALPAPTADGSDDGKVPAINGTKWELKDTTSKPLYITIDATDIDERIYTLTDGNKTYTVEEIYEAKENGTPVFIAPADIGAYFQVLDFSFSNNAFKAFFLNVVRRTDMSYGRLILSTIGEQTKGTYNVEGFLATAASANNGKFLKMKQDGSGIEYVDRFKYFTYDARTTSADMTPAEVKAFITANPHTPIYMLITGVDTGTRPIWAVQQSWANDTVVFVSTSITRTTGVQEYKLVKAASDTAWGTISTGRLVTDDTPSVANPTFEEDIDGHANIVLGVGENSSASNENLPYLATGDYPKDTIDGMLWSDLRLYNGVFAYKDVSIDSIYNKLLDGSMLPDIDFVLSNAVLIGTVEGEITNYTNDYYNIIKDEISRNRGNIWLSFNGETIRLASWKQAGSDTYALTFFGAGAAAQPVKYVVTASASAATLTVTGS